MKVTSRRQGREAPFECGEWLELAVNATRAEVARGFVHDIYVGVRVTAGTFVAEAWSRAGHWSTIVGRPVSRYLQRKFTLEAVASFCAPQI